MRSLISLGHRCDVAFELRMHGADNTSHFFDWLATPASGLLKIIAADFDVFKPDQLAFVPNDQPGQLPCIADRETGVLFHHQFPSFDGKVSEQFLLYYPDFIRKFQFLAQRFREYVRTRPVTLVRRKITEREANDLEELFFKQYPNADARFLYLIAKGEPFETAHGHARVFDAPGSLGEPAAWAVMLAREGLIGKPYRHATAEILKHSEDDYNLGVSGRFSAAQLETAVEQNPEHKMFPLELARLHRAQRRWDAAEAMALRALERDPEYGDAMYELATIQRESGRANPEATATAFLALTSRPKPAAVWLRDAAAALLAVARVEEAVAMTDRAILADPLDAEAYFQRPRCLHALRNHRQAEYAITTAISLASKRHWYYPLYVEILSALNKTDEAIAAARKAAGDKPATAWRTLARLFTQAGLIRQALDTYQEALKSAGEQAPAIRKAMLPLLRKAEFAYDPAALLPQELPPGAMAWVAVQPTWVKGALEHSDRLSGDQKIAVVEGALLIGRLVEEGAGHWVVADAALEGVPLAAPLRFMFKAHWSAWPLPREWVAKVSTAIKSCPERPSFVLPTDEKILVPQGTALSARIAGDAGSHWRIEDAVMRGRKLAPNLCYVLKSHWQ
jgi:tetratricopeptide (TPR) repeat protein